MREKLQKWALIAEIIASIAILLTLAVLVIETRNNSTAIRAATYQEVVESITTLLNNRLADPELDEIYSRVNTGGELTEFERMRYSTLMTGTIRRFEAAYYQYQLGTIDSEQWIGMEFIIDSVMQRPPQREMWLRGRESFSPKFREYVDTLLE